jgi:hypothetical protein
MRTACAALVLLLLFGCTHAPQASTPAPPNSPQTTVALTIKTVADSASSCIDTVIQLRDTAKKITPAQATTIGNWCSFVANTDKQLGTILAKNEPWAAQKSEMLTLLATITAPTLATNIDPGAAAMVAQIMTLVNQIKVQVQV